MTNQIYGPQTYQIEKVIEKIKNLTPGQIEELCAAWDAAWNTAWDAAWDAAWDTAREAAWDAARYALMEAAWDTAWDTARYAVMDAVTALVVRDLIGEDFTQAHYDLLTKTWREVMGEFEEPEKEPSKSQSKRIKTVVEAELK